MTKNDIGLPTQSSFEEAIKRNGNKQYKVKPKSMTKASQKDFRKMF